MSLTRRSYLVVLGASASLAGCSGSFEEDSSFSVSEPSVEQGERTSLGIKALDVTNLWVSDLPEEPSTSFDSDVMDIRFEDAELAPAPDVTWTAYPPNWQWTRARNIEAAIPIRTFPETPPGEYEFGISVRKGESETERTRETTVAVASTSEG